MSYQQWTRFRTTLRLRSRTSLERIKQSTSRKRRYQVRFFPRSIKKLANCGPLTKKMTLTFYLWPWNSIGFVRLSRCVFMQNIIKLNATVHQSSSTQTFCPIWQWWRIENPVLWHWPPTYDLAILWLLSGCEDTCSRKISSSCVKRFMSYRGLGEKKLQWKQYCRRYRGQ